MVLGYIIVLCNIYFLLCRELIMNFYELNCVLNMFCKLILENFTINFYWIDHPPNCYTHRNFLQVLPVISCLSEIICWPSVYIFLVLPIPHFPIGPYHVVNDFKCNMKLRYFGVIYNSLELYSVDERSFKEDTF